MKIYSLWENGVTIIRGKSFEFTNHICYVPDEYIFDFLVGGQYTFLLKNPKPLIEAKRGLFIRDIGLGDILLCTPLLREVKKINPAIKLDFMVRDRYKELFNGNPLVNKVIAMKDISTDLLNEYQWFIKLNQIEFVVGKHESEHRVDIFASCIPEIKLPIKDKSLIYNVAEEEKEWVRGYIKTRRSVVGVVLRTTCDNRNLKYSVISDIVKALCKKGILCLLIDHQQQQSMSPVDGCLDLTGKLTVRQLGAVIDRCDVLFTPDTGTFHLASAIPGVKIVSYFGAIDSLLRITAPERTKVIYKEIECYPCNSYSCKNPRCIWEIPAETYVNSILGSLKEK